MPTCKYWLQGNCRYGSNCRFDHSRNQPDNNRFAPLNNMVNQASAAPSNYGVSTEQIRRDLTDELPQWILSCYAPGKDAPEQLFGGYPREQSFEELQLHYRNGLQAGNEQGVRNEIEQLYQMAKGQIQNALADVNGAVQFITSAENKHPNRHDVCKQGGVPSGVFSVGRASGGNQANPFGAATNNSTAPNAFGQPSALGQRPNPFGAPAQPQQPAFGQPSQPQQAFGQPSQPQPAFGQPSFGQPSQPASAFGARPTPTFGQASQPQPAATFGQPSQPQPAFGQASALGGRPSPFAQSAFGQPSQAQTTGSTFGQPSALGAKPSPFGAVAQASNTGASPFSNAANNPSPFSQTAVGNAGNPFTQAASQSTTSPFGQPSGNNPSPFGQSSTSNANPSPFANANANASSNPFANSNAANQNGAAPNPFGATANPTNPNPFGTAPQQAGASPFAQAKAPSLFGAPQNTTQNTTTPSPFGTAGNNTAAPGFSQGPSSNQLAQSAAPRTNGTAQGNGPYPPGSSKTHPPLSSYSTRGPNGLAQWKGSAVVYKDGQPGLQDGFGGGGGWTKIWFPNGPPDYSKDTEVPDDSYGPNDLAQWQRFFETGKFSGMVPELPPKRELCTWDF